MIEDGLRKLLLSKGAVTEIVAGRIRVKKLRETDEFPAIVIDVPESKHHTDMQGDGGLVESTVVFMCMAQTMQQARQLCETVRVSVAGYEGPAGSDTLQGVLVDDTTSGFVSLDDASDTGVFSCDVNCTVWHAETVPVH